MYCKFFRTIIVHHSPLPNIEVRAVAVAVMLMLLLTRKINAYKGSYVRSRCFVFEKKTVNNFVHKHTTLDVRLDWRTE